MESPAPRSDQPLAIAFVNTAAAPADHPDLIANHELLGEWLEAAALPGSTPASALPPSLPAQRIVLLQALRLRSAIDHLLRAVSTGDRFSDQSLAAINQVLEGAEVSYRLERSGSAPNGLKTRPRNGSTSITRALHEIALDAATVLAATDPARLRQCASAACPKWFVDSSKGGRRKWCSMSTCGNRNKAASFRTRHG